MCVCGITVQTPDGVVCELTDDVFVCGITVQTPDGVVCPGRINTKALPALPDAFSYTVEVVNAINRQVSFMQVGWHLAANAAVTRDFATPDYDNLQLAMFWFRGGYTARIS